MISENGLDWLSIAGLFGALLIAGVAKGATGIGMPIVGVPLLALFIDVKRAISLITVPLIITNIAQALDGGRLHAAAIKLVTPIVAFAPGCIIGFETLFRSDQNISRIISGAMLVLAAFLTALTKRGKRFWVYRQTWMTGAAAGISAGVIAGLSGVAGPPVFIYLLGFDPTPKEFTKLAAMFLIAANAIMAFALMQASRMNTLATLSSLIATIPVAIGMIIGQRLRDRIPAAMFRPIVLAFIFVAGANLIYSGINEWLNH
jgi:uncharacterized membrane protein YfcA